MPLIAVVLTVSSGLVLLGWAFDISALKRCFNGLTPVNPLTAVCFLGLGGQLLLRLKAPKLADLISGAVVLVGAARIGAYVLGATFPMDQLLFQKAVSNRHEPNRMALITSVMFVTLGMSMILTNQRNAVAKLIAQIAASISTLTILFVLDCYALRTVDPNGPTIPMALHTAWMFGAVAASAFILSGKEGALTSLSSNTSASLVSRRLLWSTLLVPLGLCLAIQKLQQAGGVSTATGEALLATAISGALGLTIWMGSVFAHRSEESLRKAEAENRQTKEYLREILDCDPNLIFIKDRDGRFILANKMCASVFGKTPEELVGCTEMELSSEHEEIQRFLNADRRVIDTGEELWLPNERITGVEGHTHWLQTIKKRIRSFSGSEYHVLGISTDVTDRVNHESQLASAAQQIQDLYDQAPCGYHSLGPDGTVILMNETELRWLGYTREEVVGKAKYIDLIAPGFKQDFVEGFASLQENVPSREVELCLIRKDGAELPVIAMAAKAVDEEGRFVSSRTTIFDLSERQAAERRVVAAMREAERANKAKSEFLSRMSHELRTPLNSILGFAQLLELEGLPKKKLESVHQIARGGKHLLNMINEILDISRIESGTFGMSLEPVEICTTLREAVNLVKPIADTKPVRLVFDESKCRDVHAFADRQRLLQVCLNLLSNAIKYNVDHGSVTITVESADKDRVLVSVADTGIGIEASEVENLFSPFARLGAERLEIEGTGLGLALSKGLVESMGGTLTFKANEPSGSIFSVELPGAQSEIVRREAEVTNIVEAGHVWEGSRTVLLIEDNAANIELVERILETRPGVSLLVAMQGRLGIDLATRHQPDVVFLDLNLPDIQGQEVLRILRNLEETKNIPIIVTSADATPKQVRTLQAAGADDYITKPLDIPGFLSVLDGILSREKLVA
ncbi:MAG TPA: ATP-binding protein [Fimbriimonas sp.]|nr:ATP-binding protein [Fimbriimonas sp.]